MSDGALGVRPLELAAAVLARVRGRRHFRMRLDDHGVPVCEYGFVGARYVGRQRSIVAVSERGLLHWNRFLRGEAPPVLVSYDWDGFPLVPPATSDLARPHLASCALWLMEHAVRRGSTWVWPYAYPSFYGTRPGWLSAHAHAQALLLLVRAADVLGRPELCARAAEALEALALPLDDGGMRLTLGPDAWWFLKFADPRSRDVRVVNGMMFTLLALRHLAEPLGPRARELFELGLCGLRLELPGFDTGAWSRYDNRGTLAGAHYHRVHVAQLAALAQYTGDPLLSAMHARFAAYPGA